MWTRTTPIVVALPSPIQIGTPPPTVNVEVQAPPAPPPPAPEPEPAPTRLRALVPQVWAECVIPRGEELGEAPTPNQAMCSWDDGFPAVSDDGRTIIMKHEEMHPDGLPNLSIRFIDTRTSRLARDLVILGSQEYSNVVYGADKALAFDRLRELRAQIRRRVAVAQQAIAAGRFRTMTTLGEWFASGSARGERRPRDEVYAEIAGGAVRVIDPKTVTVPFQRTFWRDPPTPGDPNKDCSGWSLYSTTVWWDLRARVVLADQTYHFGGCLCGSLEHVEVARL
jgi:hypothetical protein